MYHIVIEGLDRSGKSSLIRELKNLIESELRLTVNPNHGPSKEYESISIDDCCSNETLAHKLLGTIGEFCDKMKMEDFDVLISDRHYYSTEFYQGTESLLKAHIPDLVVYVKIDGEIFCERATQKDIDTFAKQKGIFDPKKDFNPELVDFLERQFRRILWKHQRETGVPVLFLNGKDPINYNAKRAFYKFVERVDEIERRYN